MTEERSFKRRVRERMSKTGESYTAARSRVSQQRDRIRAAGTRLTAADKPASDAKVKKVTGRTYEEWISILERWGARERKYGQTVRFLVDEHGLEGWWAQTITNVYERSQGLRQKHQRPDGFTIYASKTIGAPRDVVFDAFVDSRQRKKWLTDGAMKVRTSQPGHTARFDWEDGSTRVSVSFEEKGPSKTTAAVAHERLPDAQEAEKAKAYWRQRLADLKDFLESSGPPS